MQVGQTRLHSLLESTFNIIIGYAVALFSQFLIFPLYGIQISLQENLAIGLWFTLISLLRSYTLRRLFNLHHVRTLMITRDFDCTFQAETSEAIFIKVDDFEPVWIPLSQVTRLRRMPKSDKGSITMTEFIAEQKGLI